MMQVNSLVGQGMLALDLLGSSTAITGLACTAGPGLSVYIAPGRIYSLQNIDNSAFGILVADTAHQILKQGILLDPMQIALAAPTTSGQSVNYLIEAAYADADTDSEYVLYYNSANPSEPFIGPGNDGMPQMTQRQGQVALMAKPGTAATTGTQTTPSVDSGYVALFVVTVAFGATVIGSGNISAVPGAPYLNTVSASSGTFTLTGTGFATAPTVTAKWSLIGNHVMLQIPTLSGTSNSTAFTATGMPAAIVPTSIQNLAAPLAQNNSAYVAGASVNINGNTLSLELLGSLTGWTASGTKSFGGTLTYPIN